MMRSRPESTRPEVEVAIADDSNRQSARALICQCDSDRGLSIVADAETTTVAPVTMMFIEIQQHSLPVAGELVSRTDAPVVVLDLRAQLRNHSLNADRTHVPSESRFFKLLNSLLVMCRRNLRAPRIELSSFLGCRQPPDFFDQ